MSKLTKIILLFMIIIVILIIILLGRIYLNRGEIIYGIDETGSEEELYNIDSSLKLVTVRNDFYAVKTCIQKFYMYYSSIFADSFNDEYNEELDIDSLQKNKKSVYDMLDVKYINYKGITEDNIDKKIKEIKYSIININQMYVSKIDANMYIYIAEGTLREEKTGEISNFKIMVKLDALNKSFKVFLQDYIDEYYKDMQLGKELEIDVEDKIERNDVNIYDYNIITDETYVTDLFTKYKNEILFDSENAYYHLNEEYRNKRFGSLENFKLYLNENISKNVKMKINKFQKNVYQEYTEYVCIDNNGEYYIFNEISTMNYNLILDTYTIDLPNFIEKYDNANEELKVALNIEKIISSINEKDYKYIYNKLDDEFKNNYFNSYDTFVDFVNNNFYDNNDVEYKEFTDVGNVYMYKIIVKNVENADDNSNFTIIMKLLDNRDFVMSFNNT